MTEAKDPRADVVDSWKRTRFELEELGNAIDRLPDPAPAVVPDVEAARTRRREWEALGADIRAIVHPKDFHAIGTAISTRRRIIEAAMRAEGRGALDVELLRAAGRVAKEYGKLRTEAGSPRLDTACADLALAVSHLAQREPAESQG